MSTESSTLHAATGETRQSVWPMFFVGLFLFALFFVAVRLMVLWNPVVDEFEAERSAQRVKNLEELQKQDEEQLTTYAWVDKAQGQVRIPVDRAMALQIPVLNSQEIRPAYPVDALAVEELATAEEGAPAPTESQEAGESSAQSEPAEAPEAAEPASETPAGEAAP